MNLTEAFKALDKLDEEAFSVTADGIEKLQDFTNLDDEIVDVYDVEAKSDEDVNDCHVGDGILDCSICHSKIFKPITEIVIDEEQQLANVGEECPYCFSVDGYNVIGKVEPIEEVNVDEKVEVEEDIDKIDIETDETNISIKDNDKSKIEHEEVDEIIEESTKDETIGAKLKKYQKWVDYDMKRYGKISETTQDIINKEGLQLIKDQYGDYEVSVGHYKAESCKVEEDLGSDIKKYQKWIDYDMKRYGKLSDVTKQKIEKAGLQVVKDQYGDYEVTAGEYKAETLEEKSQLSDIKGTLGNILTKYQDKLNKLESTEDAISFLTSIKDEVKDKKYLDSVIEEVKKLSFAKALSFLYNIILKGDNLSSKLESLEEVEIKADDVEVKVKTSDDKEEIEEKEIIDEQIVPIDDIDIEKIDRETIQTQTEECLKENYKNVNFFRVNNIVKRANKFFVEGIVGLKSGKKKNVKMMYEAFRYNNNKVTFLGESATLNIPHNALYLQGKVSDKKLFTESLIKR